MHGRPGDRTLARPPNLISFGNPLRRGLVAPLEGLSLRLYKLQFLLLQGSVDRKLPRGQPQVMFALTKLQPRAPALRRAESLFEGRFHDRFPVVWCRVTGPRTRPRCSVAFHSAG